LIMPYFFGFAGILSILSILLKRFPF